jgi:hypothetical protein
VKIFTQGGCHGSITGPNDRGDEATKLFCCNAKDLPLRGEAAGEILWQSSGSTQQGRYPSVSFASAGGAEVIAQGFDRLLFGTAVFL